MNRRTLLGTLAAIAFQKPGQVRVSDGKGGFEWADPPSSPHVHDWVKGPFYVSVAETYEEPGYYPPSGLLRVEHCKSCGILRLPKGYWDRTGDNLYENKVVPAEKPKP